MSLIEEPLYTTCQTFLLYVLRVMLISIIEKRKWWQGRDLNPRVRRHTGFQDQPLGPGLGTLPNDSMSLIKRPISQF